MVQNSRFTFSVAKTDEALNTLAIIIALAISFFFIAIFSRSAIGGQNGWASRYCETAALFVSMKKYSFFVFENALRINQIRCRKQPYPECYFSADYGLGAWLFFLQAINISGRNKFCMAISA
ncbi:hypothetical protein [Iodobacter ciconiae]|uniref:hypothetical protein n=1 Tax=Iodobacter ciconiae TaxID=2496266 RepID=UPI0013DF68C1|nr:hypothetical protein [Iodobacter ciconiae]